MGNLIELMPYRIGTRVRITGNSFVFSPALGGETYHSIPIGSEAIITEDLVIQRTVEFGRLNQYGLQQLGVDRYQYVYDVDFEVID